jgi:sporulation protein YlmC with PRC-barrel domain
MKNVSISLIVVFAAVLLIVGGAFGAGAAKGMKGAAAGPVILSKDLIGKEVVDQNNQKIGKIENLVLDRSTGRVSLAIVQTKGFIEIGEKFVAIPFQSITAKDGRMEVNMTKDKIAKAPTFTEGELKSINRSTETEVYKYYGVAPYWEGKPMMKRERTPGMAPK